MGKSATAQERTVISFFKIGAKTSLVLCLKEIVRSLLLLFLFETLSSFLPLSLLLPDYVIHNIFKPLARLFIPG